MTTDGPGPTVWQGQDTVFNPLDNALSGARLVRKVGRRLWQAFLISTAATCAGVILYDPGINAATIALGGLAAGALWLLKGAFKRLPEKGTWPGEWFSDPFRVVLEGSTLSREGRGAWSLALADVATVEAGQTVRWERARNYVEAFGLSWPPATTTDATAKVPDAEMQTFVMTSDGRRLVVHTANADVEGTSALALSIRGAIEAARAAPLGAASPSPAAPEKGFSL